MQKAQQLLHENIRVAVGFLHIFEQNLLFELKIMKKVSLLYIVSFIHRLLINTREFCIGANAPQSASKTTFHIF